MKKFLLAAAAVAMMAGPALAENYKFAVVPKAMNNPFFDVARDGCMKRAKELGNVECIYK
jgi:ribose transport system substrate-binding protein